MPSCPAGSLSVPSGQGQPRPTQRRRDSKALLSLHPVHPSFGPYDARAAASPALDPLYLLCGASWVVTNGTPGVRPCPRHPLSPCCPSTRDPTFSGHQERGERREHELAGQADLDWNPSSDVCCVTLGELLNLSESQLPLSEEGVSHVPQVTGWLGCHAEEIASTCCLSS